MKTTSRFKQVAKLFSLYFIGFFLIGIACWTQKYFGKVTINQLLSTINFDVEGAATSDSMFLHRLLVWCVLWPSIISAALVCLHTILCRIFQYATPIINKAQRWLIIGLITVGIGLIAYQYSVAEYLIGFTKSSEEDAFKKVYVDPNTLTYNLKNPKSIVIIYVEGLETTYSDTKLFGHDLLSNLDHLSEPHTSFKYYHQMPGTGWTIAGLISTQCAIPLKVMTIFNGNHMGENINHYLPGATCLSDILAKHGYENVFMKGASLRFSGAGTFLNDHHYTDSYGREEWLAKGYQESQMNGWGLPDDLLFSEAKKKLATLIKANKLFNLSLITVDTHGYDGFIDSSCHKKQEGQFDGVVECTANEVSNFIHYVSQQGWLDKLNIIVVGDHLAMQNADSDKLDTVKHRTIFNLIISNQHIEKNTSVITHFDLLPTILELSGFTYNSDRVGLGYSAIGKSNNIDSPYRLDDLNDVINNNSQTYNALWDADLHHSKK